MSFSKSNDGLGNFSIILFFNNFKDSINDEIKIPTTILSLSRDGDTNYG